MASPPADLLVDTTPRAQGGGRYLLDLADHWDFLNPSGGVLVTAALRAAARELDDDGLRLASATAIFCAPVTPWAFGTATDTASWEDPDRRLVRDLALAPAW